MTICVARESCVADIIASSPTSNTIGATPRRGRGGIGSNGVYACIAIILRGVVVMIVVVGSGPRQGT